MADSTTGDVHGARDHARAQAGSDVAAAVVTQPTIPATSATDLPAGVEPGDVVWDETLGASGYAARIVRRGTHLRIAELDLPTNVSLVLHHSARTIERLNVADTVKLQWNAYPGPASLLLSDMGRVLATVLDDSTGSLDLLCGASIPEGRGRLLLGLAKHGLTRRDLPPAANLFTPVRVDAGGGLRRIHRPPDPTHVTVRAELDLLVSLAVTPHPLDDPAVGGGLIRVTAWQGAPAGADDPARRASPEAQRAFENTDDVLSTLAESSLS
ncbi:MAG TPA: DUF1989 domain-containing protein [Acidimicrobiales bacterium]|jgi:hypothetical protein